MLKSTLPDTDTEVVAEFLQNNCERNISEEKEAWQWKYVIKDEKLGNSIFLFYSMKWEEAMQLLKRGTINVILHGPG